MAVTPQRRKGGTGLGGWYRVGGGACIAELAMTRFELVAHLCTRQDIRVAQSAIIDQIRCDVFQLPIHVPFNLKTSFRSQFRFGVDLLPLMLGSKTSGHAW